VTGSLVTPAARRWMRDLATPVATALGRLGLSPNALTLVGFLGTCLAGVAAGFQAWLVAGILVIVFGIFDLFDGALARATGQATSLGAFYDSVFDRAGELVVYLGIAWGALDLGLWAPDILVVWAMAAATMVSYVRAKSESLGFTPGTGMAAVGLAPREIRVAVLGIGLIVSGLLPGFPTDVDAPGGRAYPPSALALDVTLGLIAILATITTIQRIVHVRAQAREG